MKRNTVGEMGPTQKRSRLGGTEVRLLISSKAAGSIIGKDGCNIKKLRTEYEASVTVSNCFGPERILNISADMDTVLKVLMDVIQKIQDAIHRTTSWKDNVELHLLVHQSQVGCIIGKSGFKIKELRKKTGALIEISPNCCPQSTDQVCQISGRLRSCTDAITEILELIKSSPVKGVNIPYGLQNYYDSYLHSYGSYGSIAESQGGRRGGPGDMGGGERMGGRSFPSMESRGGGGRFGGGFMGPGPSLDFRSGPGPFGCPRGMGGPPMDGMGGPRRMNKCFDRGSRGFTDGRRGYNYTRDYSRGMGNRYVGSRAKTQKHVAIPKDLAGARITTDHPLPGSNDEISISGSPNQIQIVQESLNQRCRLRSVVCVRDAETQTTKGVPLVSSEQVIDDGETRDSSMCSNESAKSIHEVNSHEFKLLQRAALFADKTKFISKIFDGKLRLLYFLAPKRFGKSTLLDTLKTFASIPLDENGEKIPNIEESEAFKVFMDLELGKADPQCIERECGKYPVIHLSFEDVEGDDKEAINEGIREAMAKAFLEHKDSLLTKDRTKWKNNKLYEELAEVDTFMKFCLYSKRNELTMTQVEYGLRTLAKFLYYHFNQKVVILIDEVDAPIIKAVQKGCSNEILQYTVNKVGNVLKRIFKGTHEKLIRLGVMTSCIRVPGIFSHQINNVTHIYFLSDKDYIGLFGFTENEIDKMLSHSTLKEYCEQKKINGFNSIRDMKAIDKWYNGYESSLKEETSITYCNLSVLSYIINSLKNKYPCFDTYWDGGGHLVTLRELFKKENIRLMIHKLLNFQTHSINIVDKISIKDIQGLRDTICSTKDLSPSQIVFFFQLLADDGVLNIVDRSAEESTAVLKVPNYEIKLVIEKLLYTQEMFMNVYKIEQKHIEMYTKALEDLLRDPNKTTCQELADAIHYLYSNDASMPQNEFEFHAHLYHLAWIILDDRDVQSNKPAESQKPKKRPGRKREFDMLVVLGNVVAIFEFKFDYKSADDALKQSKQYSCAFENQDFGEIERKILIGLHMDRQRKVTISAKLDYPCDEIETVTSVSS